MGLGKGLVQHLSSQLWAYSMSSVVIIMSPYVYIIKDASRVYNGHQQRPTILIMGLGKSLAWHLSSQLWARVGISLKMFQEEHEPARGPSADTNDPYYGPIQGSCSAPLQPALGPFNVTGSDHS
jgi:hypothetical protein